MQTILVIDDERIFRDCVQRPLRSQGFVTLEAAESAEGIRLARERQPDLILSDVHIDGTDGYALLETLREDSRTATIPVVLMTGMADEVRSRRAMELGADDFLAKPFSPETLLATVQAQLRKRQVQSKHSDEIRSRLLAIIEATTDLVAIADVQTQGVLYLNRAGRRMIGRGLGEDLSQQHLADFYPPWALRRLQTVAIPAVLREGVWNGETAFLNRDGREVPVSQLIQAHRGAEGTVEYLSTIARDITERTRVEQERQRLVEELNAKRMFLDSVLQPLAAAA
jgi:PAS domain S-box-containing protein